MDLGWSLVCEQHSRRTYHNSVRHSFDHSARIDAGTSKDAPHNKPRCMCRTAFCKGEGIMILPPRLGPIAQPMDTVFAKSPKQFFRYS